MKSLFMILILLLAGGCASSQKNSESSNSAPQLSAKGPNILNVRSEPGDISLNRQLQPNQQASVLADVKDFHSPITDVRLQFNHVPLDVPMTNVGGTTWRADLTPQQLQMLAVSGRTVRYDAKVVAKDANGDTAESRQPVSVAITAPDLSVITG